MRPWHWQRFCWWMNCLGSLVLCHLAAAQYVPYPKGTSFNSCLSALYGFESIKIVNIIGGPYTEGELVAVMSGTEGEGPEPTKDPKKYSRVIVKYTSTLQDNGRRRIIYRPETIQGTPRELLLIPGKATNAKIVEEGIAAHGARITRLVWLATTAMSERRGMPVDDLRQLAPKYMNQSTYIEIVHGEKTVGTIRVISAPYGIRKEQGKTSFGFHGPWVIREYYSLERFINYQNFIEWGIDSTWENQPFKNNFYLNITRLGAGTDSPPWWHGAGNVRPAPGLMMEELLRQYLRASLSADELPRLENYFLGNSKYSLGGGQIEEYGNLYVDPEYGSDVLLDLQIELMSVTIDKLFTTRSNLSGRWRYTYGNEESVRLYHRWGFRKLHPNPFLYHGEPTWFLFADDYNFYSNFAKVSVGKEQKRKQQIEQAWSSLIKSGQR